MIFNFLRVKNSDSSTFLIRVVTEIDKRAFKELPEHMKDLYSSAVENIDFDDSSKEKIITYFVNTVIIFLRRLSIRIY